MGIRCKFCDAVAHEEVDPAASGFVRAPVEAFLAQTNADLVRLRLEGQCAPLELASVDKV